MKRTVVCLALLALLLTGIFAFADEGMWLYNAFPKAKVKAKYGFEPTQAWLDHLRLASVRMGASASFVSPDGLVFTNHHVGRGCVHAVSTPEKDYIKTGFYAKTREEELKCPNMEVGNLIDIKDVTKEVESVGTPGMSDAEVGAAQRKEIAKLQNECSDAANNIRCEVVTLYSGGMYNLYKYKRYNDVRLVMAPEYDIAFFGGDPDNFTYPRYDLDITFFRVYENGKPIVVKDYLPFTTKPIKEGDLVFVSGHPGSTGRLLTVSQLEYLRDSAYPFRLKSLESQTKELFAYAAKSEENRRAVENMIFGVQNSFKALTGYQGGLLDKAVMSKKVADEKKLRDAVMKDPVMAKEFGGAWDAIAAAMNWQKDNFNRITFMTDMAVPGRVAGFARTLVRIADGTPLPEGGRGGNPQQALLATTPVDKQLDAFQLRLAFETMVAHMGANDPYVMAVLGGKSAAERADELANSKLTDAAYRKELLDGGKAAIDASTDPMIVLMRKLDPESRVIRKEVEDKVTAVVRRNGALIAKARFKLYGTDFAPDATGTLRLSYGVAKSYKIKGQKIPYYTTIGGAFDYAAKHDNKPPYKLPESWMKAKSNLNLATQLDSVNTADIIGGNSGSPAVNKNGEVVGILFDGNIESLPWNFQFDEVVGRSVITNTTAVVETLRKVYGAPELADELMSAGAAKKPAAAEKKALAEKKAAGE